MAVFRLIFRQLAAVNERMNERPAILLAFVRAHIRQYQRIACCLCIPNNCCMSKCLSVRRNRNNYSACGFDWNANRSYGTMHPFSHWWWHATKILFHWFFCLDFVFRNAVLSHAKEPHWNDLWQEKVPTRNRYVSRTKATNQFDLWEIRKLHFVIWWNYSASNNSFISINHRLSNCRIHMQPIQLYESDSHDSHDSTQIRMCEFVAKWMSALPTLETRKWRQ